MEAAQREVFKTTLFRSSRAVFAVAFYAHRKGHKIHIPPVKLEPTGGRYVSAPGPDLFVDNSRIEVKHRTFNFTGADDWPFPDPIVSNCNAVEFHGGAVAAYVSVSGDLRHMAVMSRKTAPHWYRSELPVSNKPYIENNYCCPLHLVTFHPLTLIEELNADNHLPR